MEEVPYEAVAFQEEETNLTKSRRYIPPRLLLSLAIRALDLDLICYEAGIMQTDRKTGDYVCGKNGHLMCLDWGTQAVIKKDDREEVREWGKYVLRRFGRFLLSWSSTGDVVYPQEYYKGLSPVKAKIKQLELSEEATPKSLYEIFRAAAYSSKKEFNNDPRVLMKELVRIYGEWRGEAIESGWSNEELPRISDGVKEVKMAHTIDLGGQKKDEISKHGRVLQMFLVQSKAKERLDVEDIEGLFESLKSSSEERLRFCQWLLHRETVLEVAREFVVQEFERERGQDYIPGEKILEIAKRAKGMEIPAFNELKSFPEVPAKT